MTLESELNVVDVSCETFGTAGAADRAGTVESLVGDLALVKRAQSGDDEAFSELVAKYRRRILKMSLRYTHHEEDAEDATQNAFLKAHRAILQFRGDAVFYSWLCRIAINSAKSIRSNRIRDDRIFEPMHMDRNDGEDAAEVLKEWVTPDALLAAEEVCTAIGCALSSLRQEQRMAIVLREFHELTYEEVATAMACPVGTVRSRVFRAREAIDRQLDGSLGRGLWRSV